MIVDARPLRPARQKPFRGKLSQEQVDGLEFPLVPGGKPESPDLRHFAYMLATTFWKPPGPCSQSRNWQRSRP